MAKAVNLEQLQKDLKEGKITKAKYEEIRRYIVARPTRENGATDRNVRKYAREAGLSDVQLARVDELIDTMNSGIEELRGLIGNVEVQRSDSGGKKVKGKPLPRWFCNVVPLKPDKVEEEVHEESRG